MLKRAFGTRPGSFTVALVAALGMTLTPALTRPSAAGPASGRWPQQGPPQGQQQWPQQGPPPAPQQQPQWPQQGPPQWPQQFPPQWPQQPGSLPWGWPSVDVMLIDLEHLYPQDVAITEWNGGPLLLWRGEPVTLVDVRYLLDDNQINDLLDGLDNDPLAGDSADGVTQFLQQEGLLPDDVGVVGADLLDGPPALFVLPY